MSGVPIDSLEPEEQHRVTRMNTIGKAIEDSVKNRDIEPEDVLALAVSLIRAFGTMTGQSYLASLGQMLLYSEHCYPVDMGEGT